MKKIAGLIVLMLLVMLVGTAIVEAAATQTVTVTRILGKTGDQQRTVDFTYLTDDSYATGGESLTAAMLGMTTIYHLTCDPVAGFVFAYDYTNSKILIYTEALAQTTGGGADSNAPGTNCRAYAK